MRTCTNTHARTRTRVPLRIIADVPPRQVGRSSPRLTLMQRQASRQGLVMRLEKQMSRTHLGGGGGGGGGGGSGGGRGSSRDGSHTPLSSLSAAAAAAETAGFPSAPASGAKSLAASLADSSASTTERKSAFRVRIPSTSSQAQANKRLALTRKQSRSQIIYNKYAVGAAEGGERGGAEEGGEDGEDNAVERRGKVDLASTAHSRVLDFMVWNTNSTKEARTVYCTVDLVSSANKRRRHVGKYIYHHLRAASRMIV